MPPATFEWLVFSLSMQVQMELGEKEEPNFEFAQHAIDMLAMLQEKTRGNLTLEEQRALENSLTELRFRFVQAKSANAKS